MIQLTNVVDALAGKYCDTVLTRSPEETTSFNFYLKVAYNNFKAVKMSVLRNNIKRKLGIKEVKFEVLG